LRKYELLFITNAEYDEEKVASVIQRYQDVITHGNGIVKTSEKWGKRRLAYEINDLRDGLYVLMTFDAEREVSAEIDRLMKIDQDVLRHMITRLDLVKRKAPPKKAATETKVEEPRVESAEVAPPRVVKEAAPQAETQVETEKAPKTGETTE
jgi:small subunit ribosomal protein S6